MNAHRKTRELTGRHVLFCLLGFFGVVFAVNAVLVKAATSTFGGVETSSSYKAGLMFEQDVARAAKPVKPFSIFPHAMPRGYRLQA